MLSFNYSCITFSSTRKNECLYWENMFFRIAGRKTKETYTGKSKVKLCTLKLCKIQLWRLKIAAILERQKISPIFFLFCNLKDPRKFNVLKMQFSRWEKKGRQHVRTALLKLISVHKWQLSKSRKGAWKHQIHASMCHFYRLFLICLPFILWLPK